MVTLKRIHRGQELVESWRSARKSQVCGAEQVRDRDEFSVVTSWGATLTGKRGDFRVWDSSNPADEWIVEEAIFAQTYLEVQSGQFVKTATVEVIEMGEPFIVETLEGDVRGEARDFLARGVKGEYYVIPRSFFEANYKFVE